MRAAGVIFEAKHRKPFYFLATVFLTTLSLLFFSFQKNILGDYQPSMSQPQVPVTMPMQTNTVTPSQQTQPTLPNPNQNTVVIRMMLFSPSVLTITSGTTVTWTNNEDTTPHTVTSDTGLWDSGTLEPSQSFSRTFSVPGRYAYHCNIHPFMHGLIVVVAQPSPTMTPTPPVMATPTPTVSPTPTEIPAGSNVQESEFQTTSTCINMQNCNNNTNSQTQSQTQNNNQEVNINVTH